MNILLLGGTGILGTNLRKGLGQKFRIDFTYSKYNFEGGTKYCAGEDRINKLVKLKYDMIIYNINPLELQYSEALFSIQDTVNYCEENNVHLVFISSVSALPQNKLLNSYNLKKAISEDIILTEMKSKNFTIVRFTQLFDSEGLGKKSQPGLYYLLDSVKHNKPIQIFLNYEDCIRNYTPIEVAVNFIELIILNNFKGIFNSYLDSFTFKFYDLLILLSSFNSRYDMYKMVSIGEVKGQIFFLESPSDELVSRLVVKKPIADYFLEAYNNL